MKRLSAPRAILLGTLVVGALDLIDALVFFGLRGVSARQIPQSIAAGILGRAAFRDGAATVLLGTTLHFFIAFGIVLTYYLASRKAHVLTRRPIVCGLVYGVGVYVFMNAVVIPLSASGRGALVWPVVVNGVAIHLFGVGLPTAIVVSRASPYRARSTSM